MFWVIKIVVTYYYAMHLSRPLGGCIITVCWLCGETMYGASEDFLWPPVWGGLGRESPTCCSHQML